MTQIYYSEILHEHGSIYECPVFTVFNYHYVQARNGTITWEAAWQILDDYYVHKMQTIGQVSSPDLLAFYTNLPLNLIDVLGHTHFKEEFKQATYPALPQSDYQLSDESACQSQFLHVKQRRPAGGVSPADPWDFPEPYGKNELYRRSGRNQTSHDIHTLRYGFLSRRSDRKTYFSRTAGAFADSVLLSGGKCLCLPAEVLDYIVPAALFHDIGKNGMIPIINTQHRKLNDYEFNIIQTHPRRAPTICRPILDFLIYQPVALGLTAPTTVPAVIRSVLTIPPRRTGTPST